MPPLQPGYGSYAGIADTVAASTAFGQQGAYGSPQMGGAYGGGYGGSRGGGYGGGYGGYGRQARAAPPVPSTTFRHPPEGISPDW
mmetsp:Transcript_59493/g.167615  ORF Transcript_59493/g.167615 Transcript_59493/m.167615 type:complete len:85 (-) Transcript_59493:193-447(-)